MERGDWKPTRAQCAIGAIASVAMMSALLGVPTTWVAAAYVPLVLTIGLVGRRQRMDQRKAGEKALPSERNNKVKPRQECLIPLETTRDANPCKSPAFANLPQELASRYISEGGGT